MDEILSSIRQIIADDDNGEARRVPFEVVPSNDAVSDAEDNIAAEPLALSQAQIVRDDSVEDASVVDFSGYTAEAASDEETESETTGMMTENAEMASAHEMKAEFVDPDDVAFDGHAAYAAEPEAPRSLAMPAPSVRQRPAAAQAAPMPDPNLSRDIAEELLEPATNAAVRANFSKLNNFAIGNAGITIEQVIRDMLRPMLKEWLDEHLPAVVERMVEKEIARISNGD